MRGASFRLSVELIPVPLWRRNLRTKLGQSRWRRLRAVIVDQRPRGDICKASLKQRRAFAHERWSYDLSHARRYRYGRPAVARLTGTSIVCGCVTANQTERARAATKRRKSDPGLAHQAGLELGRYALYRPLGFPRIGAGTDLCILGTSGPSRTGIGSASRVLGTGLLKTVAARTLSG